MGPEAGQHKRRLNSARMEQLKETLFTVSEGRLLLAGLAMAFLYIFWLGVMVVFFPAKSQALVGMTATQLIFGRAVGMTFGYSLNLGHGVVIPICIAVETIMTIVFYPLFVLSWRQLLVIRWLKNIFKRIRGAADRNKVFVQRYGIIGLFAFVWIPFWMTGPCVGCVIGFLLGMKVFKNLAAVLTGTYIAIFCWAFFLRQFHDKAASYGSYATTVILILVVIAFVIVKVVRHHREKEKAELE